MRVVGLNLRLDPHSGYSRLDLGVFSDLAQEFGNKGTMRQRLLAATYANYPTRVALPRFKAIALINQWANFNNMALLETIHEFAPLPSDGILLTNSLNTREYGLEHEVTREYGLEHEVPPGHILGAAATLRRAPTEIVARLRGLGFTLPEPQPDWATIGALEESDQTLLSRDLDGTGPWLEQEVPPGHILGAAATLRRAPTEIVARLRQLGFDIAPGAWPHEWEIIVGIWHGCGRDEAVRCLAEVGWTPPG